MRAFTGRGLFFLLGLLAFLPLRGAEAPLWLRYPAISPDGQTILFCYQGDIYRVAAAGGPAVPLTIGEAVDYSPVWSHDGRHIAFASDRFGNFDVFIMPAAGGEALRLTGHSAHEVPSSFSADDRRVLFSAVRQDPASHAQFGGGTFPELYSVPAGGGAVSLELAQPALDATVSPDGGKIIYHDQKGYEDKWRKHHTSAVTRDIWVYDRSARASRRLTTHAGEDRNPVFDGNGDDFYFLSERNGSFNLFRSSLSRPETAVALTAFARHPVRFLTRSNGGVFCFAYDGELYTLAVPGQPHKVEVSVALDGRRTLARTVPVSGGVTELAVAPSGKEVALVFRGEVFVSSVEGGVTRRITTTPGQERSVSFSPDGRSLLYAAERNNNWNVYRTSLARKEEPYFYASTLLQEEAVVATPAEEFQPAFSPDGKEVAYLEDRVVLRVVNLATRQARTILPAEYNYSYADGDQSYRWSPDGKWLLVQYGLVRLFTPEIGLVSSDGQGQVVNLTRSGFDDFSPRWAMGGKMMIWGCSREGSRSLAGNPSTYDVYGLFFTRAAFDRFRLSKEEFALLKEQEEKAEKEKEKAAGREAGKEKKPEAGKEEVQALAFDWDDLTKRKVRLTIHSADIADAALAKDGAKLYYLARFEKGYDLWVNELRDREVKLLAKLGAGNAGMELTADGKSLFVLADGRVTKIDAESGKAEPVAISGEMVLDGASERAAIFDHMWRQMKQKFYKTDLHGVDWDFYGTAYRRFLPHLSNNYDFAEMASEMLGELNASHTGCRYRPPPAPGADQTASLGMFIDYGHTGPGMKVAEILRGGPLDKAGLKIRAGHVIEAIDGRAVDGQADAAVFLNRKGGKPTLLAVVDPASGARWQETVRPVSSGEENGLLYRRWVRNRREEVDRLSGGRLGYVHVTDMDDDSFRTVVEEALGECIGREALIVDTRFNGGGNLHEQLSDFLAGKKTFDIVPRGQSVGYEPYDKWIKPSIVLMSEGNYSDAHLFPVQYKLKGVGKTLGMPVPGTGTFVWWERQIDPTLVFGIPQGGWRTPDGALCENNQLEPDILVRNDPDVLAKGRDQQIEAAVKELLKK